MTIGPRLGADRVLLEAHPPLYLAHKMGRTRSYGAKKSGWEGPQEGDCQGGEA
jgi:hypothetical protein